MTVSAQTPINRSTGNGVTTVFPYTFKIISDADIEVTVDDVVKTLNVDYTVSGAGVDAGGNVTMTGAPANATSVVRRRNMALVRSTDYQDQGELPATTLDNDIDATVLMVQQLDERLDRTFSLPASFSGDSTLPAPEPGYLIGWDATGENLTNIPASVGSSLVDLAAPSGSSLIGYQPAGTGAVATTVQTKLRERVSVLDFGASAGASASANVVSFQAALDYANSISGAEIDVPAESFTLNAALTIYPNTTLKGRGWDATVLTFTHTGAGIKGSNPVNGSYVMNTRVSGMSIKNSNGANLDGGVVDVCGTYVHVDNCLIQGWKYGIIFDQTEVAVIHQNNIVGNTTAQIWLVNGPEYTVGSLPNLTNRITISNNQINALTTADLILDDGGITHTICDNNMNGGRDHLRLSGVSGLVFTGNELEGCDGVNINIRETTSGAVHRGGMAGFDISGNTIGTTATPGHNYNIYLNEAYGGQIVGNTFYYAQVAALECDSDYNISNITVEGNVVINRVAGRTATPIIQAGALGNWKRQGNWKQGPTTYSTALGSLGPGAVGFDPASTVGIRQGSKLLLVNLDGTNAETVEVTSFGGATVFCTLTSSKAQGFLVFGANNDGGAWTPTVVGDAPAGVTTYGARRGNYTVNDGICTFNASVTWTGQTGAGQFNFELPIAAKSGADLIIPIFIHGTVAAGVESPGLYITGGTSAASGVYTNNTTGALNVISVAAAGSLYASGSYPVA